MQIGIDILFLMK